MRLQDAPNTCGPTALSNALACHGLDIRPDAVGVLAKTDATGTEESGLATAMKTLGFEPIQVDEPAALYGFLAMGHPVVMCVDNAEHWVTAVGVLGGKVLVVDPAADGVRTHMVQAVVLKDFIKRAVDEDGVFYGIAVVK